jgi:hypothetical protein
MFYLAHEICRVMNFKNSDNLLQMIFVTWAKLRIEQGSGAAKGGETEPKSREELQKQIIKDIADRLKSSYKSLGREYNVNFSMIAQFAAFGSDKVKGDTTLAKNIMDELEPSVEIQVYFFICLQDYKKAM